MAWIKWRRLDSAEANLGENALAGEQLGAQTDDEAQHGKTAVPGLSESHKTEAGVGVGHERYDKKVNNIVTDRKADAGEGSPAINSWETLKSFPSLPGEGQNRGMAQPSSEGLYRVRLHVEREQSVPQQVSAPRFVTRDDAETFAHLVAQERHQSVVVEKLAPGGCWLQLSTVAAWAA
jgi:hypothetical protein